MGAKSKCTPENKKKALAYVLGGYSDIAGDEVPSIVGLALHLGVTRKTLYNWSEDPELGFAEIMEFCMDQQERALINKGLNKTFDSSMARQMLVRHGYVTESYAHTSPDGSMSPPTTIKIVAGDGSDG